MDAQDDVGRLADLLDRYGADFDAWPDAREGLWARRLVMAEPRARTIWDEARALDAALGVRAGALDADIAASGAMDRVRAGVAARLPARRDGLEIRRWAPRIAAGFLIATVMGGAFDRFVWHGAASQEEVIILAEVMLFGPDEVEFE